MKRIRLYWGLRPYTRRASSTFPTLRMPKLTACHQTIVLNYKLFLWASCGDFKSDNAAGLLGVWWISASYRRQTCIRLLNHASIYNTACPRTRQLVLRQNFQCKFIKSYIIIYQTGHPVSRELTNIYLLVTSSSVALPWCLASRMMASPFDLSEKSSGANPGNSSCTRYRSFETVIWNVI